MDIPEIPGMLIPFAFQEHRNCYNHNCRSNSFVSFQTMMQCRVEKLLTQFFNDVEMIEL